MALLVVVVILVVVVVGVAHWLRLAEDGRMKAKDEEDDKPLLLHVLMPLLETAPKWVLLVDGGPRLIIIVNVCKPGGVRPLPAATAAAITREAHCKSRRQ